eukprot:7789297-Alexandrium_andersonii.AAC.1
MNDAPSWRKQEREHAQRRQQVPLRGGAWGGHRARVGPSRYLEIALDSFPPFRNAVCQPGWNAPRDPEPNKGA